MMVAGLGGAPMDGGGARGAYAFVISEGSMVCVVVIDLTASKSFFGRDRLVRQPPRPLRSEDTLSERKKDATLASSLSRRCSPRGTAATFRSSMTRDREQLLDDAILLGRHRITWFFGGSVVFVEHHQKK